jgi:hypothetical protein
VYRNNVTVRDPAGFGIYGDGAGEGQAGLNYWTPGWVMKGNVIAGAEASLYPTNNYYPADLSGLSGYVGTDGQIPGYNDGASSNPTPTPTPTQTQNSQIQFSSSSYNVNEDAGSITVIVTRTGSTAARASVRYATLDVTATSRSDYDAVSGTITFAAGQTSKSFRVFITNDFYVESNETFNLILSNVSNANLGSPATATVTMTDDDTTFPATNPIDDASFFVRQNYVDFLNREPDASGLAFWTTQIANCGKNTACIQRERVNISEAFYLSIEFQATGYLVYRTYGAAFGQSRVAGNVPLRLSEFQPDIQRLGKGLTVNSPGWETILEANKVAYFNDFVTRPAFIAMYSSSMSNAAFVSALNINAGGALSLSERAQLEADLTTGIKTRAQVLRAVVEDSDYIAAQNNKAFVLTEYFGYLRRDPDEFPDINFDGYNFWLKKLNTFKGSAVNAEMVKAFIASGEYRQRFGP